MVRDTHSFVIASRQVRLDSPFAIVSGHTGVDFSGYDLGDPLRTSTHKASAGCSTRSWKPRTARP